MINKIIKIIKNKFFKEKDLFEELTTYKSDEEVFYDKEVFDWFYGTN